MTDAVYSGLASYTPLLPIWVSTFSHLRNQHVWQPSCFFQLRHATHRNIS